MPRKPEKLPKSMQVRNLIKLKYGDSQIKEVMLERGHTVNDKYIKERRVELNVWV